MRPVSIDIETIPQPGIMDTWYPEWAAQKYPGKEGEELEAMAALHGEFGQVVSVALYSDNREREFTIGVNARDERDLLEALQSSTLFQDGQLLGHNLKGFDIPFLAKRYLANKMEVPEQLCVAGKKPWEVTALDTMELMKFGGFQPMSLRSACYCCGLGDPKADCSGDQVWSLFRAGKFQEIAKYNMSDAVYTWRLFNYLGRAGALRGMNV